MKKRYTGLAAAAVLLLVLITPMMTRAETVQLVTAKADVSSALYQEGGLGSLPGEESSHPEGETITTVEVEAPHFLAAEADVEGARAAILEGLKNRQSVIDLLDYNITTSMIRDLYIGVVNDHPELFYVTGGYTYSYYSGSGIVVSITPGYLSSAEEAQVNALNQKVQEIIASCITAGMTEEEKALALHDYLVLHCSYDLSYSRYNAYNALVEELSVCQGYALAYKLLLTQVGIDAVMVSSNEMNHAWNLIKVDDAWYHVDATWDDPVRSSTTLSDVTPLHPATGTPGYARHTYFLVSDTVIADSEHNHSGWSAEYTCNSTKHDADAYWTSLKTPVLFLNGNKYYLREGSGSLQLVKNDSEILLEETCRWTVVNSASFYRGIFSGFSYADGLFYYNTGMEVKSYRLSDGEGKTLYTLTDDSCRIYGTMVKDQKVYVMTGKLPSTYQDTDALFTVPVVKEVALGVALTASQSTADPGDLVTITATGNGGDGKYQYKFIINDTANDKWYKLQDYSSNNTIQWTATTAGTKRIMVDIKDGTGKTVGKNISIVVNGIPELNGKLTASAYEVNSGDIVTLTATAMGGSGKYNYKFIINDKTDDKWYRLQDFGTNSVITWTATTPGTKRLMVDIMDSQGRKFGTNITIIVK